MPLLKNAKHELFAQAIARGETGRAAYREAGSTANDASCDVAACRLLKNVKVSARIAELRSRSASAEKTILTKSWVIEQVIEVMREARKDKSHSAATRCLELLAREAGAFVEQKRITVRSLREMTAEEVEEMLAELAATPEEETDRRRAH